VRRRFSAADRPAFRRDVAKAFDDHNVGVGDMTEPGIVVVCVRGQDFDPQTNVLWELEANRSAVRPDVLCQDCKSPLAMSHHAYGQYTALDKKPKVMCVQCMQRVVSLTPEATR